MPDADPSEGTAADVALVLAWQEQDGQLLGDLVAENVSTRSVRLSGKPSLIPLDVDGRPIGADNVVSAEFRDPGYVVLSPGARARSRVAWAGWSGRAASGEFIVSWSGGEARLKAVGPRQPSSEGPATNLTSDWFQVVS